MSKISHIIHQTWKDSNIPERLLPLTHSWKEFHPQWGYKLWTDEMNRDFIKEKYPHFLDVYDSYPHNIQRVDTVRYFILLSFGGVYVDLDFQCIKNIEPILNGKSAVFGLEPDMHCRELGKEKVICNAFMACEPDNIFMREVCEILIENEIDENFAQLPFTTQVLESTGPLKLTSIYDNSNHKGQIELLSPDLIYPLDIMETQEVIETDKATDNMQKKINDAYAVHYFMGSWWGS